MPKTGVDYADYNITVYRSCPYNCVYCWAWRVPVMASRIRRGRYVPSVEAERVALRCRAGERVVVSFTSDPYPFEEAWRNWTRGVILTLRRYGECTVMVLTKNPVLALKDRDVMVSNIAGAPRYVECWLGTTITSADTTDMFSAKLEPNSPKTDLRLRALKEFQREGGYVWVSVEPIIPTRMKCFRPETIVKKVIDVLDTDKVKLVVLGRLNYVRQVRRNLPIPILNGKEAEEWYREHVPETIDILREHGIKYHVKKELAKTVVGVVNV